MNLLEKEQLIAEQAAKLETASAEEVVAFAVKTFPRITFACSFGAEDVVLVDILQKISPGTDIFYLDTDYLFRETYETRDVIAGRYNINFIRISPLLTPEEQAEHHGAELWTSNPNDCCNIRRVEPLTRVLSKYDAWITRARRSQKPIWTHSKKLHYDVKFGLVRFNPLADWTSKDVWTYIRDNGIYYNPLHDRNYAGIGCKQCTRAVSPAKDRSAAR